MTPSEIKHLRKNVLKISTEQLGKLCGVSKRTVEQWETEISKRGHRTPGGSSLKLLQSMADARNFDDFDEVFASRNIADAAALIVAATSHYGWNNNDVLRMCEDITSSMQSTPGHNSCLG